VQEAYGQVKDQMKQAATSAVDALSAGVNKADDTLRDMIEQHPYTTAAIALAIGYVIGRLGSPRLLA
jgi:ElaB/YqjD/DUF883 family membrane-anchored ribosome-binding protein